MGSAWTTTKILNSYFQLIDLFIVFEYFEYLKMYIVKAGNLLGTDVSEFGHNLNIYLAIITILHTTLILIILLVSDCSVNKILKFQAFPV